MKRVALFCLASMAVLTAHAAQSDPIQAGQPFTAVFWTTTTLHTASGKPVVFVRRTVCTRDEYGKTRREIYKPTKGLQHDLTAPLERVIVSSSSQQGGAQVQPDSTSPVQDAELGTSRLSGFIANGRRQTLQANDGRWIRTLETWYSPALALPVHASSSDAEGGSVVSDLTEFHPGSSSSTAAPVTMPTIPLLALYRGLFAQVDHMERARLTNDPGRHVDMKEIEDHLRKKLDLSKSEWQTLVEKSTSVAAYTREAAAKAHTFAKQDIAAHQAGSGSQDARAAGRATLHNMQVALDTHIQDEIDTLNKSLGASAAGRVESYLQGPFALSASIGMSNQALLKAQKAKKEQAQ